MFSLLLGVFCGHRAGHRQPGLCSADTKRQTQLAAPYCNMAAICHGVPGWDISLGFSDTCHHQASGHKAKNQVLLAGNRQKDRMPADVGSQRSGRLG